MPTDKASPLLTSSRSTSERTSGYGVPSWVNLSGQDVASLPHADQVSLFRKLLDDRIHGIAFSPYIDDQKPGHQISEEQIRARLDILAPHVRWIRTFSCIEGHEHSPRIARDEYGLQTMVGVDLGPDLDDNELQLAAGIEIAQAGDADILVIGNENMLREDIPETQLLDYIARAKAAVSNVPISFVDAYYLFERHPAVAEACDVLLVNCYPFWESCPAEYALLYMKEMYRRAVKVANGKKVIITETGWPTSGTPFGTAVPSFQNALEYVIRTYQWANEDDIEIFYFAAFDEAWKVGGEGDVGTSWGLWDAQGNLKHV